MWSIYIESLLSSQLCTIQQLVPILYTAIILDAVIEKTIMIVITFGIARITNMSTMLGISCYINGQIILCGWLNVGSFIGLTYVVYFYHLLSFEAIVRFIFIVCQK